MTSNNNYCNGNVSVNEWITIGNTNSNDDILIRVAHETDTNAIVTFICQHYYPDEPLTIGNDPKVPSREDIAFSMSIIGNGVSIVAIDLHRNNQIVGCLLAGAIGPNEADDIVAEAERCDDKKWQEILYLLARLERNANLYRRYGVDKALHVHAMGVDRRVRGKSIGIKLMRKCMENGKANGYPLISLDCTSVFSIRIAEKLQLDCVGKLAYADYTDANGKQLFRPPLPHTHVQTYAKLLWTHTQALTLSRSVVLLGVFFIVFFVQIAVAVARRPLSFHTFR